MPGNSNLPLTDYDPVEKQDLLYAGVERFCKAQYHILDQPCCSRCQLASSATSSLSILPKGTLRAANEIRWYSCIANAVVVGGRTCEFCDEPEGDESGSSCERTDNDVDVYVIVFGVQTPRPALQSKGTNYVEITVTDDKRIWKRYDAHPIFVEGLEVVCICSRLTVCENNSVAEIGVMEMSLSSVAESFFVDDDRLAYSFFAIW